MKIETLRHDDIFQISTLNKNRGSCTVDIIGVGATGSKIALGLAKLGLTNIRLFDDDKIEEHNIANQAFLPHQVGMPKVEAMKELAPYADFDCHNELYTGQVPLGKVVFLLVDCMDMRKRIFNDNIKLKKCNIMIETRMGASFSKIITINPSLLSDIKFWEDRWYPNDQAEVSSCGASISVGCTSDLVAGYAVWQFVNWANVDFQFRELNLATTGEILFEGVE